MIEARGRYCNILIDCFIIVIQNEEEQKDDCEGAINSMVINQMRRLQLLWKMYYKVNFLTPVRGTALRDVYLERIFQRIIISRKGDGSNTAWLLCFFHFVYDFKVPTRYRVVIHLVQVIQWKNERALVKRKG